MNPQDPHKKKKLDSVPVSLIPAMGGQRQIGPWSSIRRRIQKTSDSDF